MVELLLGPVAESPRADVHRRRRIQSLTACRAGEYVAILASNASVAPTLAHPVRRPA